jgi:hypothetical protein
VGFDCQWAEVQLFRYGIAVLLMEDHLDDFHFPGGKLIGLPEFFEGMVDYQVPIGHPRAYRLEVFPPLRHFLQGFLKDLQTRILALQIPWHPDSCIVPSLRWYVGP